MFFGNVEIKKIGQIYLKYNLDENVGIIIFNQVFII
jgi:hypothetical protein